MRKIVLFLIFNVFAFSYAFSQINCGTEGNGVDISLLKSGGNEVVEDTYTIRIYLHVIRKSSGIGGVTEDGVKEIVNILKSDFSPYGIFFYWDGIIDDINSDEYYNYNSHSDMSKNDIYYENNHIDGVDIYLFPESAFKMSRAFRIGENSALFVSGEQLFTHIITHEMGHVFNLFHTFHNTIIEWDDYPGCLDDCTEEGAKNCGDKVEDTPADFGIGKILETGCKWIPRERDTCANGQLFSPLENNYMSYVDNECINAFTPLQVERMKKAIANIPHLQDCIYKCEETAFQSAVITSDKTITGCSVKVSEVTIQNNTDIIIEASNTAEILKNFELKIGSTLEVR